MFLGWWGEGSLECSPPGARDKGLSRGPLGFTLLGDGWRSRCGSRRGWRPGSGADRKSPGAGGRQDRTAPINFWVGQKIKGAAAVLKNEKSKSMFPNLFYPNSIFVKTGLRWFLQDHHPRYRESLWNSQSALTGP